MSTVRLCDNKSIETLEKEYKLQYPGFEPHVWAAMAYYAKGMTFEGVRTLLGQRFGPDIVAKRDALLKEALQAGKGEETIFEIEDITQQ